MLNSGCSISLRVSLFSVRLFVLLCLIGFMKNLYLITWSQYNPIQIGRKLTVFSLENRFCTIKMTLVISMFIFKPENVPYFFIIFKAVSNECWLLSKISVVSSANCVRLNSVFSIFSPIIFGFKSINLVKISARIKKDRLVDNLYLFLSVLTSDHIV